MGSGASKPTSGNKRNDENTVDHVLTALDGCLTKEKPLIEVLRYLDFLHSLVGCEGKMTDVQKNDAVKLMKDMIQRYTDKNKEEIIALCVMTLTWLSPAQDFKGIITESVVELLAKKIKQMIDVETEVGFKIQPAELYNAIAYCSTCDDISKIVARSNILDLLHEVVVEKKEGGAEAETSILTLSLTAKNVNLVYDTVNRKVNTWRRLVQNRTKQSNNVQIKDFQVFISCADSIEGKAKDMVEKLNSLDKVTAIRNNSNVYTSKDLDRLMADIETSGLVVIFANKAYMSTVRCKLETKLAREMKKPIVGFRMTDNFRTSEWLEGICSSFHHHISWLEEIKEKLQIGH